MGRHLAAGVSTWTSRRVQPSGGPLLLNWLLGLPGRSEDWLGRGPHPEGPPPQRSSARAEQVGSGVGLVRSRSAAALDASWEVRTVDITEGPCLILNVGTSAVRPRPWQPNEAARQVIYALRLCAPPQHAGQASSRPAVAASRLCPRDVAWPRHPSVGRGVTCAGYPARTGLRTNPSIVCGQRATTQTPAAS